MKTLAPDMLANYRRTVAPEFREYVESFLAMSEDDQLELLIYGFGFMANQYQALLNMIHGVGTMTPPTRAN